MNTAVSDVSDQRKTGYRLGVDPNRFAFFDAAFYATSNDGAGSTVEGAFEHYWLIGRYEGRSPGPLFDLAYYRSQISDARTVVDPVHHYLTIGANAGLSPHPLFDPGYYAAQLGPIGPTVPLAVHYLTIGWQQDLAPHPLFDPVYYRETSGTGGQNVCPLVHYLTRPAYDSLPHYLFSDTFYVAEIGRLAAGNPRFAYAGEAPLLHYVRAGARYRPRTHPLFDPSHYAGRVKELAEATQDDILLHSFDDESVDVLRHYVTFGVDLGLSATPYFDRSYYELKTKDALTGDPLRHYLTPKGFRATSPHPGIDLAYYDKQVWGFDPSLTPALLHLIAVEKEKRVSPHPAFDRDFYLATNPDVGASGYCPILHFLSDGMEEGRLPNRFFSEDYVREQEPLESFNRRSAVRHYLSGDRFRKTRLVFVSHDASLTGAPGTVLRLMEDFAHYDNVECFAIVGGEGPRIADFKRAGHTYVVGKPFYACEPTTLRALVLNLLAVTEGNEPVAAIVNSAESRFVGIELARAGIPVITLVHESADLYPAGAFNDIGEASRRIIFGSRFVRDRAADAIPLPNDVAIVRGQGLQQDQIGRMPRDFARAAVLDELNLDDDTFLVIGCGSIDYRKGADLFVSSALHFLRQKPTGRNACFVWIGEGASGSNTVQAYASHEIRMHGAEQDVRFIGGRSDVEPYFVAADAFLMTSRIDPFPCVVQEAMAAAVPVIAFHGGGGAPEIVTAETGYCVPYGDTLAMAGRLLELAADPALVRRLGDAGRRIVRQAWRADDYARFIAGVACDAAGLPITALGQWAAHDADARRVLILADDWKPSPLRDASEQLARELNRRGFAAEIVFPRGRFTDLGPGRASDVKLPQAPYSFIQPPNVMHTEGGWRTTVEETWNALLRRLRNAGPCVVIAQDDELGAALAPLLPGDVAIVGVSPTRPRGQPDEIAMLADSFDGIVATSCKRAREILSRNASLADKLVTIPPAAAASSRVRRHAAGETLRLFVSGVFVGDPALARTLVDLASRLSGRRDLLKLIVHCEGELLASLAKATAATSGQLDTELSVSTGRDLAEAVRRSDVAVILDGDYRKAMRAVQALEVGCIPIVCSEAKDFAEFVVHGENGFLLRRFDADVVSGWIVALLDDADRRQAMSAAAVTSVRDRGLGRDQAVDAYVALLDRLFAGIKNCGIRHRDVGHLTDTVLEGVVPLRSIRGLASPGKVWGSQTLA